MRTRSCGRMLLLASGLLVSTTPLFAATLTVRQDGSGQYTTINAARAVAVAGDLIEVGPGVYAEEVDINIPLTLVSTHGAGSTVLDGSGIRRILVFRAGDGSVVDGFTLRDGYHASSGGALRVQLGARVTVRNCVFEGSTCDFDGAAVICRDATSRLDVFDSLFRDNVAARFAGAAVLLDPSTTSFTRCTFERNSGASNGAIATNYGAVFTVTDCVFVDNTGAASAIYAQSSQATIRSNTFHDNHGAHSTIMLLESGAVVERNILANDTGGTGLLLIDMYAGQHSCNLYWNNAGGNVEGDAPDPTEMEADPLFCDAGAGNLGVALQSPAAPAASPCGQLIGALPATDCTIVPPPVEGAPVILNILDVPDDQGRQVRLRWSRSSYDAPGDPYTITGYAVYRRQNDAPALSTPPPAPRGTRTPLLDGWDYIATVPARGDSIYQYVAPTLCDTPKNGDPCWSYFFVSAMTPDPLVFFDSAPDSGDSRDNLPPGPPAGLVVNFHAGSAALTWEAPADPDVAMYRIYRAVGAVPEPGAGTLVGTTTGTSWSDPGGAPGARYLLAAVDDDGNEGLAVGPETTTGVPAAPGAYFLGQNSPNPFNPSTGIEFGVPPGGGHVAIEIFDVAGRRVRTLLDESRPAGTWRVTWDGTTDRGTHATSGVYFYRLRAPGFESTRRMTLVE